MSEPIEINQCFADFEFTCGKGINRWTCETLSIGIVICDESYQLLDTFYCTCKPLKHPVLTETCIELTHLTQEEIDCSPDSNDAMAAAYNLLKKHGIRTIKVWGNFDVPALTNDARLHKKAKQDVRYIHKIANKVVDVQDEMTKTMTLPEAIRISELASAFGFVPPSGTFHNALNDALALYTVYKNVFTTNFTENEEFQKLRQSRIDRANAQRETVEENRLKTSMSTPLSDAEQEYYTQVLAEDRKEEKSHFIMLRSRVVSSLKRNPDDAVFYMIVFNNKTDVKVVPECRYVEERNERAIRIHRFERDSFGSVILAECMTHKRIMEIRAKNDDTIMV